MKIIMLALLVGIMGFSQTAEAKPPACKEWDKNRDGQVKLLEMQTALREQFIKTDSNKDGFTTVEETLQLMPFFVRDKARPAVQAYIRAQDTNNDGKNSLEEVINGTKKRFKSLDKNGNGALDAQECKAAEIPTN